MCTSVGAWENLLFAHCSLHYQSYKLMLSAPGWAVNHSNVSFPIIPLLSLLFNFLQNYKRGLKILKVLTADDSFLLLSQTCVYIFFPSVSLYNISIVYIISLLFFDLLILHQVCWFTVKRGEFPSLSTPFPMDGNFIVLALWLDLIISLFILTLASLHTLPSSVFLFHFLSDIYLLSHCQA